MICSNCGHELPDGVTFCTECGAKVEIPAAPATPAETPAAEPVQETVPVDSQPAAEPAPAVTEPAPAPAAPTTAAAPADKKTGGFFKNHKGLCIGGGAVILVIILIAAFLKPISNTVMKIVGGADGYYRYVEKNYLKDTVADACETYELSKSKMTAGNNTSVTGNIGIEFSGKGASLLDNLGSMLNVDLTWIQSIDLSASTSVKDNAASLSAEAKVNGKSIVTAEALANLEDDIVYARIPEVDSSYIYFEGVLDNNLPTEVETVGNEESQKLLAALNKSLPSKAKVAKIVNRYVNTALKQVENVKRVNSKNINAKGIKQKLTVLEVEIDEDTMEKLVVELCNQFLNDKELKNIIIDVYKSVEEIQELDDTAEEFYDDLCEKVEEISDNASVIAENYADMNPIEYKVYVNGKGEVVGRSVETEKSYGSRTLVNTYEYVLTRDGGKYGFELKSAQTIKRNGTKESSAEQFKIESKGEVSGNKYTGKVDVKADDFEYSFDITDVNFKKVFAGILTGEVNLPVSSQLLDQTLGSFVSASVQSILGKNLSVDVAFETTDSSSKAVIALYTKDTKIVSVTVSTKIGKASKISFPSEKKALEISDTDDLIDWASGLDISNVYKKLEKAGASNDVLDFVDDLQDLLEDLE